MTLDELQEVASNVGVGCYDLGEDALRRRLTQEGTPQD